MTIDLDSRRSIRKITREDFNAYAVWEWALNEEQGQGHGVSFVRPTALASLPLDQDRDFIVGASATLNDDSVLPACAEVSVRSGKARVAPMCIFLQDRQLDFGGAETRTVLGHYTRRADAHLVSWVLAVPLDGQSAPLRGKVGRALGLKLRQLWSRLSHAASRKAVLVP